MEYTLMILFGLSISLIARFVLKIRGKELTAMVSNIAIAIIVLYLINISGFAYIEINIYTTIITVILGVPGVVVMMILAICGVI